MSLVHDQSVERPWQQGDALRLAWKSSTGQFRLEKQGYVWTITRILPMVFCLNNKPGICVERNGKSMWITFPCDPHFDIVERLNN